jgi:pimeloyl-ACP methyl ester carboxylesterase
MIPSFVSFAGLYNGYLRRCFTGAGLFSQKIDIDNETSLHFWGPTNQSTQKPSLLLIHGFGPMAMWQWRQQVQFLAPHFNLYVPDLIFFGESTTKSKERTEIFQAESVGKLLEKIGVRKCHVAGTSYGGIVAYNLAKMLGEEKIEKVVIASSGVNMTKNHNVALLKRAGIDKIEDLMLPSTTQHLRKLMTLCVARRIPFLPNFFLKDFLNVSSTITLLNCDIRLKWLITCWQNLTLIFYKNNFFLLDFITEQFNSILSAL